MKTRLLYLWDHLQTSFWFLPLIIIFIGIGLSIGLIYIDSSIDYQSVGVFLHFFTGGVDSARIILSTVAAGMLGVAGIVFSITLVALTMATAQFGSRILRNFMHDRINQVVLGTYLGTFTYCLLILRSVKSEHGYEFIPNISVLLAIVFSVFNIILLIIFIHHISVSIQADHVISDVTFHLNKRIKYLFPERKDEVAQKEGKSNYEEIKKKLPVKVSVPVPQSGYLQVIDYPGLLKIAGEKNYLLHIKNKQGDYLPERAVLVELYSSDACDEKDIEVIANAFILGDQRTPTQDAEYAIHQLVEIAARALSPGVNDPYTAITCIDNLTSTMCYMTEANFPPVYYYDPDENLRIIAKPLNFNGVMNAAFNQIRQYGEGNPPVLIRLMEALITINGFAVNKEQKNTVDRHIQMVLHAAENSIKEPGDLKDLKERYDKL